MADESIISYSNIIGPDDTFEVIEANLDALEKQILSLVKNVQGELKIVKANDIEQIEKLSKSLATAEKATKTLNKQREVNVKTRKKLADLTDEELIQREREKIAARERVKIAKQQAILTSKEAGEIEKLRARLALTTIEWKKLSKEELENTKAGKRLIKEKLDLTNQLKRLEKQTGDTRRNVGNYTDSLSRLGKITARVFLGRSAIDALKRLSSGFLQLVEDSSEGNERISRLGDSIAILQQNAKAVAVTFLDFIAGPLTGFLNGVSFLVSQLTAVGRVLFDTGKSIIDFARSFTIVRTIIDGFVFALQNIPAIFGGIIAASKQLASNVASNFRQLGLQLQILFANIEKVNPFSDRSIDEIEAGIRRLRQRQAELATDQVGVFQAFRDGFNETLAAQEEFTANQEVQLDNSEDLAAAEAARTQQLERQNQLISESTRLESERIQAIISLQDQLARAEAENIEDRQEQAFRLEELRFQAEQKQLQDNLAKQQELIEQQNDKLIELFGENSKEVQAFQEQADKDLLKIQELNQKLSEEQLTASEERKLAIRKEFALKRLEIETIDVTEDATKKEEDLIKDSIKSIDDEEAALAEKRKDRLKQQEENTKQLLNNIKDATAKIGEAINDIFEKQVDISEERVETQTKALEDARERARLGLENNLKFEQEELAKRESERLQAEKRQQQAAKLTAILNIIAAAAAAGDPNAAITGIAQIGLIEGLESLFGFIDGTENVEESLGKKNSVFSNAYDNYLGMTKRGKMFKFDGGERIFNPIQNQLLGSMSNDDAVNYALLGQHMSDLHANPMLDANTLRKQTNDFVNATNKSASRLDTSRIEGKLDTMTKAINNMPDYSAELERIEEDYYILLKKYRKGNMTKTKREKKRLN